MLLSACNLLLVLYLAPALALMQNLAPPAVRGTSTAVFALCLNVVGLGGGPLLVGVLSDRLSNTNRTEALPIAMLVLPALLLMAGLSWTAMARLMIRLPGAAAPPGPSSRKLESKA